MVQGGAPKGVTYTSWLGWLPGVRDLLRMAIGAL